MNRRDFLKTVGAAAAAVAFASDQDPVRAFCAQFEPGESFSIDYEPSEVLRIGKKLSQLTLMRSDGFILGYVPCPLDQADEWADWRIFDAFTTMVHGRSWPVLKDQCLSWAVERFPGGVMIRPLWQQSSEDGLDFFVVFNGNPSSQRHLPAGPAATQIYREIQG